MSLDTLFLNKLVFRKIEGGQIFPKCPHDSPLCFGNTKESGKNGIFYKNILSSTFFNVKFYKLKKIGKKLNNIFHLHAEFFKSAEVKLEEKKNPLEKYSKLNFLKV